MFSMTDSGNFGGGQCRFVIFVVAWRASRDFLTLYQQPNHHRHHKTSIYFNFHKTTKSSSFWTKGSRISDQPTFKPAGDHFFMICDPFEAVVSGCRKVGIFMIFSCSNSGPNSRVVASSHADDGNGRNLGFSRKLMKSSTFFGHFSVSEKGRLWPRPKATFS